MASNSLAIYSRRFGRTTLESRGFRQIDALAFEKPLDGFSQGLGFVKGRGPLEGKFTADVYLRYTHSSYPSEGTMDYCQRIGLFDSGRDEWYQISDEQSWAKVGNLFVSCVEPFFLKLNTIQKIIAAFENASGPSEVLFGIDRGWRAFNIGHCYAWMGRKESALKYLRELVEQHSQQPFEWVQNRKRVALESLKKLGVSAAESGTVTV